MDTFNQLFLYYSHCKIEWNWIANWMKMIEKSIHSMKSTVVNISRSVQFIKNCLSFCPAYSYFCSIRLNSNYQFYISFIYFLPTHIRNVERWMKSDERRKKKRGKCHTACILITMNSRFHPFLYFLFFSSNESLF